jgi:hypothetical protein
MADTQQLVNILGSTLSPDPTTRRSAERELTQLQSQPSFASVILQLAQDANTPKAFRQAAVVNFKGWIRANYGVSLQPLLPVVCWNRRTNSPSLWARSRKLLLPLLKLLQISLSSL